MATSPCTCCANSLGRSTGISQRYKAQCFKSDLKDVWHRARVILLCSSTSSEILEVLTVRSVHGHLSWQQLMAHTNCNASGCFKATSLFLQRSGIHPRAGGASEEGLSVQTQESHERPHCKKAYPIIQSSLSGQYMGTQSPHPMLCEQPACSYLLPVQQSFAPD